MKTDQIIGTAFEYAEIRNLSSSIANDLDKLISLMVMYNRPANEIKLLSDTKLLVTEYNFSYTSSALKKFINL